MVATVCKIACLALEGYFLLQSNTSGEPVALKCGGHIHKTVLKDCRVFSRDVMAAMLETNPVKVKLFSYTKTFFCFKKFAWLLANLVKTP